MEIIRASKELLALPSTLTANTLYMVRAGTGFDFYLSDQTGQTAHRLNVQLTWSFLSDTWSETPQNIATIAAGDVWSYTLSGVTRYRLVPSPYDPTLDAFYTDFDGANLTGLIVTRG